MNKWIVGKSAQNERLLAFAKQELKDSFSLKDLRWAIEHHRCRVNGVIERFCSRRLKAGDVVELNPLVRPSFAFEPSRLLFETDEWLAYDKPPAIASDDLAKRFRLFLVHRLDRDTTGVLLLAKTSSMQKRLEEVFRHRQIKKSYLALVKGRLDKREGIVENYIGKLREREGEGVWGAVSASRGDYAKTEWSCINSSKELSLVRCHPLTGRTHQIRVHMSGLGFPIVGDLRYGNRTAAGHYRPLLHAENVSFPDPLIAAPLSIEAPLPDDFLTVLNSAHLSL